jgi:2-keto-4-pentenoate hydratase/2-oxohepta-3-ene-1,7-dioic acid hydratase in catechol pathway
MIFSVAEIIAFLSGSTTLLPGTVILTGTPEGVGMAANPPRWLKPGDQVAITIEGIGTLRNPVVAEGGESVTSVSSAISLEDRYSVGCV